MYICIRLHLYFYKLYICMHTDAFVRLFLALFHSISLTRCHSPSLFLSCACECLEKEMMIFENFPVLFQIEDAQLCNLHTNGLAGWLTDCMQDLFPHTKLGMPDLSNAYATHCILQMTNYAHIHLYIMVVRYNSKYFFEYYKYFVYCT